MLVARSMAAIARDNLAIIRIPRKVVLLEVLKKIGGSSAKYESWFGDGKYYCTVKTIIASTEPNTSGKLEQATGSLADNQADAEESAALVLIQLLMRVYRFEIDDMNFMPRARNEYRKEQLEKEMCMALETQSKQRQVIDMLSKGWNQSLHDMELVQEVCEDVCGSAFATLPAEYKCGPYTEMMYDVSCLSEWTEQKIYESIANFKDTIK